MARRNMRDGGSQTGFIPQPEVQCIMVDKGTQKGPPTRDIGTQTEWIQDAGMQTEPETPLRASFMGLPAEIRMQIYEQALTVECENSQPRLRDRADLEIDEDVPFQYQEYYDNRPPRSAEPHIADNAILRVSRQTHNEAIELFYYLNKFHYSVLFLKPQPHLGRYPMPYDLLASAPFHLCIEWMTDVSIDYAGSDQHGHGQERIDEEIADHVKLISKKCPKLRVFTMHLL